MLAYSQLSSLMKEALDKCWAKKLLLTHSLQSKSIKNRKNFVEAGYTK